jgi:aminoglycoside phosphotransferase (APT) family kinase protein
MSNITMNSTDQGGSSPEAIKDQKVIAWIETHVGGSIERCERQSRWRGGWWVDVRRDGRLLRLYVREERKEEFPPWPLEHEAGVLQVLEKHGVPAPHIYGICADPHAIVMEALPGHDSTPAIDEQERRSVLQHFAEAMAKMHAIDPGELVKRGFLKMPASAEEISLGCFKLCEAMYLRGKKRPDPPIEFLRRWIYRNIPRHRSKVSIVSVDSGQFRFENGQVTGLYDFEYACLGDPWIDLAMIPGRVAMMNLGDSRPFYQRYAELAGEKLELEVITFHRVWFGLCTPLIVTPNLHAPPAEGTYFEYIAWYISPIMGAMLALADMKGLRLDQNYEPRPPTPSRWAQLFDVMAARIPQPVENEPYAVLEQRKFVELAKRMDAHRDIEAEYLQGVERLLGHPVRDWMQADAELESFVMNAGPEHDAALISLFYRWTLAQAATLIEGIFAYPILKGKPRLSEVIP